MVIFLSFWGRWFFRGFPALPPDLCIKKGCRQGLPAQDQGQDDNPENDINDEEDKGDAAKPAVARPDHIFLIFDKGDCRADEDRDKDQRCGNRSEDLVVVHKVRETGERDHVYADEEADQDADGPGNLEYPVCFEPVCLAAVCHNGASKEEDKSCGHEECMVRPVDRDPLAEMAGKSALWRGGQGAGRSADDRGKNQDSGHNRNNCRPGNRGQVPGSFLGDHGSYHHVIDSDYAIFCY